MWKRKSQTMEIANPVKKVKISSSIHNVSLDLFEDLIEDMFVDEMSAGTSSSDSSKESQTIDDDDDDDGMMDVEFDQIDAAVNRAVNEREMVLDLSVWRRCIVTACERDAKTRELILRGREDVIDASSKPMVCRLQDAWMHSKVAVNDVVSLLAVWNTTKHCYCVSSREGFVVIRPDFLVSGTSVVGGLFCLRKSVLADRFKGIDANNKMMTVGSIIHELLQLVLRRKLKTLDEIRAVVEEMLNDPKMAFTLYASQMSSGEARGELEKFVDKIYNFVQRFVNGRIDTHAKKDENFDGQIDSIRDIEENIWMPRLGLKGKVDVSATVRLAKSRVAAPVYMPLELKTGRASFSSEHTGQLVIYQMMLSEIHSKPIDAGLLLYLRECVMRQVKANRNEKRDLIMLRNEVAYYLSKHQNSYAELCENADNDFDAQFKQLVIRPELPEPIVHHSACQNCPYQVLCCMYLSKDPKTMASLSKQHPLREMSNLVTIHLTEAHIEYFTHWVGLLALEDYETKKGNQLKSLWLETPETRQQRGHAVIDLSLDPNVTAESDEDFVHIFRTQNIDLTKCGLSGGQYLIVSTATRLAVAAGRVRAIDEHSIQMSLERNLTDRYSNCKFILDKYESQTISSFNMASLGALLDDTAAAERLRSIVIDRLTPTFTKVLPRVISTVGKTIFSELNPVQRSAVLKALTVNEYLLLKGLPGTGKTQTLAAIIRLLVLMGKSVLVTSHTHSAVDNVLVRLMKSDPEMKFLRLGAVNRIRPELADYSESRITAGCQSAEELKSIYDRYLIVGVTCLGSAHPLLTQRTFDVCLVDESTQVIQVTALRPLFSAKKFILVGDPDQLPPIVKSIEARQLGADESLFARLDSDAATVALTMQYRMNRTITKLANGLTYGGALKCANDQVAKATMKLNSKTKSKWLQKILSPHIDQSIFFLNTGNVHSRCLDHMRGTDSIEMDRPENKKNQRIYTNHCEAAVILEIIYELLASGLAGSLIGVIAPYALQVGLLKQLIGQVDPSIEVNTVDQYQGRDKEIIIYSCTRTGVPATKPTDARKMEILEDKRRLTVAITRAKHKLIVIGDAVALEQYAPFKCLIGLIGGLNKLHLQDEQQGFRWADVMQRLN